MKRVIAFFLLAVLIMNTFISTERAFAIDEQFYSSNSILLYNPDDTTCTSLDTTADEDGGRNAEIAYNFYIGKGLKGYQAAAIVGNFQQESGEKVSPQALNSIGAYGIAQWLGLRKDKLLEKPFYTDGAKDKTKELGVQLDYSWEEMQGSENAAYKKLINATTTDPGELAVIFGEAYERYGKDEEGNRAQYAKDLFSQHGSGSGGACQNTGAEDFIYYSQTDSRWVNESYGDAGTIGIAGSAPTSLAMIIATFFDKSATPVETAKIAVDSDAVTNKGTDHEKLISGASNKWNYVYRDISGQSIEIAIQAVKDGELVFVYGAGPAPFTLRGNYVVLRGVTDDNRLIIADPYRNASDIYTSTVIEANSDNMYIVYDK